MPCVLPAAGGGQARGHGRAAGTSVGAAGWALVFLTVWVLQPSPVTAALHQCARETAREFCLSYSECRWNACGYCAPKAVVGSGGGVDAPVAVSSPSAAPSSSRPSSVEVRACPRARCPSVDPQMLGFLCSILRGSKL